MPELSRFFGIIVVMYYNDHEPAHFHVRYAEQRAKFSIEGLTIIDGAVSARVRGLVTEWGSLHVPELRENWRRILAREPLLRIDPLT